MIVTLISLVFAFFMGYWTPVAIDFDSNELSVIMLVGGTAVFLCTVFLITFVSIPFENLEQKLIPNLLELIRKDKALRIGRIYLFAFPLISFICVAFVSRIKEVHYQDWLFLGWLISFGVSLDIIRDCLRRLVNFLNPSYLVARISDEAVSAIQNDKDHLVWTGIDTLTEIGINSVERSKLALSTQTLQTFPPIIKAFLDSSKSISHIYHDRTAVQGTGRDEASYTIFYLLQRLEVINDRALRDRLETVCRQMTMSLGKIIVHCANYDLSMVSFPTHFLTKFGLKAQQHHFDEVAELTTSTLLEIGKTILTDIDVTYAELQDPFKSIVNGLTAIAKGSFKKRKDQSIKVLMHPLFDLKAMFQNEKMIHHRDTPAIVAEIDKVIDEFTVLEQVMYTMPPLTDMGVQALPGSPPKV